VARGVKTRGAGGEEMVLGWVQGRQGKSIGCEKLRLTRAETAWSALVRVSTDSVRLMYKRISRSNAP
jgi:hypothetical protein